MPEPYLRTGTILDTILAHKADEVAARRESVPLSRIERAARLVSPPRDFRAALALELRRTNAPAAMLPPEK